MRRDSRECLGTDVLTALLAGELALTEAAEIERHIDRCSHCAELVAHLARTPLVEPRPDVEPPTLGRFRIERELGRGGMGVVYLADDPQLGRQVALKVLRPGQRDETLREARALARLSHPNVVAIFDIGTSGDEVFIAMEYLPGPTLRDWAVVRTRSWRDIARAYLGAGRGLAAAHAQGLVHRDFKPTNVLVTPPDRVVVLDFGLARSPLTLPSGAAGLASPAPAVSTLRRPGVVVGTPAYMAPEQREGAAVDERSDQFSYCVAFFEAIFGAHPFLRPDQADLSEEPIPPPAGSAVPGALRRVIERGLSRNRSDRFPSMHALLDQVEAALRRRHRRIWLGAAAFATAGVAAAAMPSADSRCRELPPEVAAAWNDARKAEVRTAFDGTQAAFAGPTFEALAVELDGWSSRWHDAYADACAATHLRGEQTEDELEDRMVCLRRAHRRFAALVDLLRAADRDLVGRSLEAAGDLPTIDACGAASPSPDKLGPASDAVARAEALRLAARLDEAEALAREAQTLAQRDADRSTEISAGLLLGRVAIERGEYEVAQTQLEAALWAAEAAGHDALLAETANALTWLHASHLVEPAAARRYAAQSEAAVQRLGGDEVLTADRLRNLGWAELRAGRADSATELFERARQHVRPGGRDELMLRNDLGAALVTKGAYEEAEHQLRGVVEDAQALLGPGHPNIAIVLNNLAGAQRERGELEAALATYREIRETFASNGGGHALGRVCLNLGTVLADLQRTDEAAASFEEALRVIREAVGDDHPDVARAYDGLASVHYDKQELDQAIAGFERAIVIKEAAMGPDHPGLVVSLANLGMSHADAGRPQEALAPLQRAAALIEASFGKEHPNLAVILTARGSAYRDLQRLPEARADLERAVAIGEAHGLPSLSQSRARLAAIDGAEADLGSKPRGMDPG